MKTKISCMALIVLMVFIIIGTIKVIEAQGAESDYYYIDSTTIELDTIFPKTNIIVYENEADIPTWTKEITVN